MTEIKTYHNKDLVKIVVKQSISVMVSEAESQTIEFEGFDDLCYDLAEKAHNHAGNNIFYFDDLNTMWNLLTTDNCKFVALKFGAGQKYFAIYKIKSCIYESEKVDDKYYVEITESNWTDLISREIISFYDLQQLKKTE